MNAETLDEITAQTELMVISLMEWERLIEIARDKTAREAERDDAIMDLAIFNNSKVIDTLFEIASEETTEEMLKASAGESLAEIWIRAGLIDFDKLMGLSMPALNEALAQIEISRIDWYREYQERIKNY